jgi:hypothetical protein
VEKLKLETKGEAKVVPVVQSSCDEVDSMSISESEYGENIPSGFCGFKYFEEMSVLKGE